MRPHRFSSSGHHAARLDTISIFHLISDYVLHAKMTTYRRGDEAGENRIISGTDCYMACQ